MYIANKKCFPTVQKFCFLGVEGVACGNAIFLQFPAIFGTLSQLDCHPPLLANREFRLSNSRHVLRRSRRTGFRHWWSRGPCAACPPPQRPRQTERLILQRLCHPCSAPVGDRGVTPRERTAGWLHKHGGCCRPGPKVGGGTPTTDPTTVAQNNGFCGRHRRWRFCFSLTAGGDFLFSPHVFLLKMLRFFRGFHICQRHVEQFSAHFLPTSDFIPRIECWGLSAGGYTVRSFFLLCCPLLGSSSAGGCIVLQVATVGLRPFPEKSSLFATCATGSRPFPSLPFVASFVSLTLIP